MTEKLPGFDPSYIFGILSDFWDGYKERDQLATIWGGLSQITDDLYLQNYQADFSKSLETVPVYWRYTWAHFDFDNWQENDVLHRHMWVDRNTSSLADKKAINLNSLIAPEIAGNVTFLRILLDGVVYQEGVDYRYSGGLITFVSDLPDNVDLLIQWVDVDRETPYHTHKEFSETLTATKSEWTDAHGDAFDPETRGPYENNNDAAPIEIWINGVRELNDRYLEPSSTLFQLNVANPPEASDRIVLRWMRLVDDPNPHAHYKYNYIVQNITESTFSLPFEVDESTAHVYVNGIMLTAGADYSFQEADILLIPSNLDQGDLLEVEFWKTEFRWKHVIGSDVVSAPILQDGIDKPTIISTQNVNHIITPGWIYSDYNFSSVWAPNLWVDENTIKGNFGIPVGFEKDESSVSYLYSTRGIWYVYWNGPSVLNIRRGAKIILDIAVSPADTKVLKITQLSDMSNEIEIQFGDMVFTVPYPLKPIVSAGQEVTAYEDLADGVEVWDYINKPDWWQYIPSFQKVWVWFSTTGSSWIGHFDDRGFLDDGGTFDDSGNEPGISKDLYELIKYFTWILVVDSSAMQDKSDSGDLIKFADTIKPAYTDYIAIVESNIKKRLVFVEDVSLTLTLAP